MRLYKQLLMLTATMFALSSCETEEYFDGELVEPEVVIRFPDAGDFEPFGAAFTELDDIEVDLAVEGNVNSVGVGVTGGADNVGSVAIANGVGTFTATPAALEVPTAGNSVQLRFTAPLPNGGTTTRLFDVEITDPITLSPPIFIVQSPDANYINFGVETNEASVDNITVEAGTGGMLTAIPAPTGGWAAEGDSIAIVGANYEVGDTVQIKVTATSGTVNSERRTSAIVRPFLFPNESPTVAFDSVGAGYDLVAGGASVAGADTTDVEFSVDDQNNIQLTSQNGTGFVSANGLYTEGNAVTVQEAYDAGTPVDTTDDLEEGDEIIYRTERTVDGETQVYYGIIQITDVDRTNEGDDSISLRYKF